MAALRSRCGHYVFVVFLLCFFLVFFVKSQRSQTGCQAYFCTWCRLSANLERRSEMCWTRLAEKYRTQKGRMFIFFGFNCYPTLHGSLNGLQCARVPLRNYSLTREDDCCRGCCWFLILPHVGTSKGHPRYTSGDRSWMTCGRSWHPINSLRTERINSSECSGD